MRAKKYLIPVAFLLVMAAVMAAAPGTVFADGLETGSGQGKCISCHTNLYFLHDTGKWYCLREASMSCVDCHGGDPNTLDMEQAHTDRAAHPVFNEDHTKCLQCHPALSRERLQIFRTKAGIKEVIVKADYVPVGSGTQGMPATEQEAAEKPGREQAVMWVLGAGLIVALIAAFRSADLARRRTRGS